MKPGASRRGHPLLSATALLAFALALLACGDSARAQTAHAAQTPASALRARLADAREALAQGRYHRPLTIASREAANMAEGEILVPMDLPLASLRAALSEPAHWCDVLILHLNTKSCRAVQTPAGARIELRVARRYDQMEKDASLLRFAFSTTPSQDDHFGVRLDSPEGPLGTRDYRIVVEAAATDPNRSVLRMVYSFGFGTLGRMALGAYLSTAGRQKVGFTQGGADSTGLPVLVGGTRGLIERNTMRYYLAIESYMATLPAPGLAPEELAERRFTRWFEATERYQRQLHELDLGTYVSMKRTEYRRMQSPS